MNIRNYKLFIDAKNASGIYQYNLQKQKNVNKPEQKFESER